MTPAFLRVVIAPDGLSAWLEGGLGRPAKPAELKDLLAKLIRQAGLVSGLRAEAIKEAFRRLAQGEALARHFIALGRPPQPGQDGRVQYHVNLGQRLVGRVFESGHMDFRDRGDLPVVQEGQKLATLIEPVPGQPGLSVRGKPIEPAKPARVTLKAGKNTSREGQDVVARKEGLVVEVQPGRLAVLDLLKLPEVGFESGNVTFPGLVSAGGGVREGFKVKAEALVAGTLENNAEVEVDESVRVQTGIMGARVQAGASVSAQLVRKSHISAQGDVIVGSEIVDSTIIAGGRVRLTSPGGRIVGSRIEALMGVETTNLLSAPRSPTHIVLGKAKPDGGEALKVEPGRAGLTVRGEAQAGLTIEGLKSRLVLERSESSFTAREMKRVDPKTGLERWVVAILDASGSRPKDSPG